jgi:hypothetical protein
MEDKQNAYLKPEDGAGIPSDLELIDAAIGDLKSEFAILSSPIEVNPKCYSCDKDILKNDKRLKVKAKVIRGTFLVI